MIGQEPERHDDDKESIWAAMGIAIAAALGYIAVMVIGALMLYGCSSAPPQEKAITEESIAARETRLVLEEYIRLGEIVKDHPQGNPWLTPDEVAAIGRAVYEYADRYGVGTDIVAAVIVVESSGHPDAVSSKGAVGLMQVMPRWSRELGIEGDLRDIDVNIRIGTFLLADNIRRWGEDEGIERYFWGTSKNRQISTWYLARVKSVLEGLDG